MQGEFPTCLLWGLYLSETYNSRVYFEWKDMMFCPILDVVVVKTLPLINKRVLRPMRRAICTIPKKTRKFRLKLNNLNFALLDIS